MLVQIGECGTRITPINMICDKETDGVMNKATDLLNLRKHDNIQFFDTDTKTIRQGKILSFGKENQLMRVESVLRDDLIAQHEQRIGSQNPELAIARLTDEIISLKDIIKRKDEQLTQKTIENEKLQNDRESLHKIINFVDSLKSTRESTDISIDVIFPIFFNCISRLGHGCRARQHFQPSSQECGVCFSKIFVLASVGSCRRRLPSPNVCFEFYPSVCTSRVSRHF